MLYDPLAVIIGFPEEIGTLGYIFIGAALTILLIYMLTMFVEFIIGIFR